MTTYIATDWHGRYDLWEQIKEFLQPDDRLIYLGDAVDRGPRGWDLLLDLLLDDRVTFIKGNHEDIFEDYITATNKKIKAQALTDWKNNGGKETIKNIKENGFTLDHPSVADVIEVIKILPTEATYTSPDGKTFICTHAGYTPGLKWKKKDSCTQYYDAIWDRDHILDNWPKDEQYQNTYIVHGHTPCANFKMYGMQNVGYGPVSYCQDHKINLDMATYYSNRLCLFNPDNFEIHIFTSKGEDKNNAF